MKRPIFLHILVFLVIIAVWVVVVSTSGSKPRITTVAPEAARPGDLIVIQGENFGESRSRGRVRIGTETPHHNDYESWADSRIVVRVPEGSSSGLVYVSTSNGRSNGALFRNSDQEPGSAADATVGLPAITGITPDPAEVGAVIALTGDHFGDIRGDGAVLFTAREADERHPLSSSSGSVEPASEEQGYVSWTNTEIRVRIPQGATSGTVRVETHRGSSSGVDLEIDSAAGAMAFSEPRNVAVQHEAEITVLESPEPPERLYFWFPRLRSYPEQRKVQRLTHQGIEPVFTQGPLELYRLRAPEPSETRLVRATTLLDIYRIETRVNTGRLRTQYDSEDAFVQRYTASSEMLPVEDPNVQSLGARAGRVGANPYKQARALMDLLAEDLEAVEEVGNIGVARGLERGRGNAFTYAGAFVAALRANGIPSRVVAGHLLREESLLRHYWAEVYLYGIGWIPADPALADGLYGATGGADAYFARRPADRVAFSKGLLETRPMVPGSERIRVPEMYFLAGHHEEVVGDVHSYQITWRNVRLLGEY
ncbi:MAG: transglutaminase domain-containing protein [bacterium]